MSRRTAPMHVAKIERKVGDKTYTSYLLRRSYREGTKVKHETLGNLSSLPLPVIEIIGRALRGEALVATGDAVQVVRTLPHGHVAAALGMVRKLNLDGLIASRPSRQRDLCIAMIVARILAPRSKLATVQGLRSATEQSTLGELLGLEHANENELYEAMDWLLKRQTRMEDALAARHLKGGSIVLYDLTSTYFEGRKCPLARRGHSRDGKRDKLQIVFGLLTDAEGRPIAVEVFDGNTGDPTTLAPQIEKLRTRFKLDRVILVGDRGMITEARLNADVRPAGGIDWITALRAPAIAALRDSGALQLSLFDTTDLAEITDPTYPGERLVVCKNPLLAAERARKRLELLAATREGLEKAHAATQRASKPLRGAKIGERVGKVLAKHKMGKHFTVTYTETGFTVVEDATRINDEAELDGFYVLRTSVDSATMATNDVVKTYKSLSRVERAFRALKTVDLKVRPIHHRDADRVRAHVFLCMLAYYVEWHMLEALTPLLFRDEDPASGELRRTSIVAPARRSKSADAKAADHANAQGHPAQGFQSLLATLATLSRVRLTVGGQTFDRLSTPSEQHCRAFELLGVPTLA